MLHILICSYNELPEDYLIKVSEYFDEAFEPDWFQDEFVRRVVQGIDHSMVVGDGGSCMIQNDVLGIIPPQYLSTGCKAILLAYKENPKLDGNKLGDNCIPYLLELALQKDIFISTSHMIQFPPRFDAIIDNNGAIVRSMGDFVHWKVVLT